MHQNAFGGRAPPGPAGGAYSAPPDPLAGFKGPTSKGREGRGKEARGKEGKEGERRGRKGGEGKGGEGGCPPPEDTILDPPLTDTDIFWNKNYTNLKKHSLKRTD